MPKYYVMWVMRGTALVEADSLGDAEKKVENLPYDDLLDACNGGIQPDIETEDAEELP